MATTQGIKLDDNTRNRLKILAAQRQRSPHWLMRTAIEDYLQREEHYEQDKSEDEQRWANYQLTGKAVDQQEIEQWLDDLSKHRVRPCPQ